MAHNYAFNNIALPDSEIEIENPSTCNIRAYNEDGEEYIFIMETSMGVSRLFMYGPSKVDFSLLPDKVKVKFERFEWSQRKVDNKINEFLNSCGIVQAEVVEDKEALLRDCKSLIEYMKQDILF